MSETEIRLHLRKWIRERAKLPANRDLSDDMPILAAGLLSSLDVTELILYVESLRGSEVDIESIEPKALTNINALYDSFFSNPC